MEITAIERERNAFAQWIAKIPWIWYAHLTTCPDLEVKVHSPLCPHKEFEKYLDDSRWYYKGYAKRLPEQLLIRYTYRWIRTLSEILYGKKYREIGKGLSFVIGIEHPESNLHGHILVYGPGLEVLSRMRAKLLWEEIGLRTGHARIFNYDWVAYKQRGIFYLAKHQIKSGNVVIHIAEWHQDFLKKNAGVKLLIKNHNDWIDRIPPDWRVQDVQEKYVNFTGRWIQVFHWLLQNFVLQEDDRDRAERILENLWKGFVYNEDNLLALLDYFVHRAYSRVEGSNPS